MEQILSSMGICTTCDFQSECISYKNSQQAGKAVLHCEEFENSERTYNHIRKVDQFSCAARNSGDSIPDSCHPQGLCTNCNDNGLCKFPGFGSSVVFCEEHNTHSGNEGTRRPSNESSGFVPILGLNGFIPGCDS